MEFIFKRFTNVLSVCITVGFLFGISANVVNNTYNEFGLPFAFAALLYAVVFAINYIFLGSATLWHKNVNKRTI